LCHRFLSGPRFFVLLLAIDRDLAEGARSGGCRCGGRLHQANYRRKPRGGPQVDDPDFSLRLSFCCDAESCRQRATPPSVRFLDRKVYLGVLVVLVTAMRQGPTPHGLAELKERFGVERRTIARWQAWWKEIFATSPFWQSARARIAALPDRLELPGSLVVLFGSGPSHSIKLLRFLSPLSASGRLEMQAF
jgi:hypothetical protein